MSIQGPLGLDLELGWKFLQGPLRLDLELGWRFLQGPLRLDLELGWRFLQGSSRLDLEGFDSRVVNRHVQPTTPSKSTQEFEGQNEFTVQSDCNPDDMRYF
ncbi:hypothetical protein TB1_030811 [Malus domestica]